MPTCPAGHDSVATDFCDTCGMRIGAPPAAAASSASQAAGSQAASPAGPGSSSAAAPSPASPAEPCPRCGSARSGRFCEVCGFDYTSAPPPQAAAQRLPPLPPAPPLPPPQPPATQHPAPHQPATPHPAPQHPAGPGVAAAWSAVVTADRAYFDSVVAGGGPDTPTLQFPAYCPERRFRLSGREMRVGRRSASRGLEPEIDLTGPPG